MKQKLFKTGCVICVLGVIAIVIWRIWFFGK